MINAGEISPGDTFFKSLKLKRSKIRKNDDQPDEEGEGFIAAKIRFFRGLIRQIDQKNNDEV